MRRLPFAFALWLTAPAFAQAPAPPACHPTLAPSGGGQVADSSFDPAVGDPAFAPGNGPRVAIDEAHFNFHTRLGRYAAFARLLTRDGFVLSSSTGPSTAASLSGIRILVVANALPQSHSGGAWILPVPAAFSSAEVVAIRDWVGEGGSLLLIADHMPFPGAVDSLATAFGIALSNGFATDSSCAAAELSFRRGDGTLAPHPVLEGRTPAERIDSVRSFTGSAFRVSGAARPLLRFQPSAVVLLPTTAWQFSDSTTRMSAEGMLQGATLRFGKGRVAVFGEAAMFSAQRAGPSRLPMGMNAPSAAQNAQFLLNLMHWLAGLLEPD